MTHPERWTFNWFYNRNSAIVTTAKTAAQRQAEFRARKREQQHQEVRGIFAHSDDHAAIKAYAEKLAKKRAKTIAAMAELQAEAQQRGEY